MAICWPTWNSAYWATTTTSSTVLDISSWTWETWNTVTTGGPYVISSGTGYSNMPVTWQSWNDYRPPAATGMLRSPAELAEAQRLADEAATRIRHDRARRQATRAKAAERALGLLMSLLSDEQQATYRDSGYFDVTGSRGRRWRIQAAGQAGNVLLLPDDPEAATADSYCCHPPGGLPDADAHIAQMLHIVTDEDSFEVTANPAGRRPLRSVA